MKLKLLIILFFSSAFITLSAKEGMWLPVFLQKYNLADMQQMGFKLTAQDIYDVNSASMKDAVVIFGGGCTGELISGDGLLITNHHCGFSQIQKHSSLEHDYITNGFWAMSMKEELINPGLTVSFLEYMEDVTEKVLVGTSDMPENEAKKKMNENSVKVIQGASDKGRFMAQVKPVFNGNQYFLYVYKVYRDVRLVGAPPSSIGKFGGDTDNWIWPRHTGDFSLFRIYAGKDNEPASYSPENVPFKPKKFFPVSLKGIKEGDFTMVFGYPGTTMEYLPHQAVELIMNQRDPDRINLRDIKLNILNAAMDSDPKVRIQYSAKAYGISNAWKKWQGEIKGLKKNNAIEKKITFEKEFENWAKSKNKWESEYKKVFDNFGSLYNQYSGVIGASDFYNEIVLRGVELFGQAASVSQLIMAIEKKDTSKVRSSRIIALKSLEAFFKDYNQPTDERLFAELLPLLAKMPYKNYLPASFISEMEKTGSENLVSRIYRKSILTNSKELASVIEYGSEKKLLKLKNDPMIKMYSGLEKHYNIFIKPVADSLSAEIDINLKKYMAGIMDMKAGQPLYPDANMTLRVGYGKVEGYFPQDGVEYKYYTTLKGIMEKNNPSVYDYAVPEKLKALYELKDFGRYEVSGDIPVCFTASNHTTGGNSGSPVVNGNGELIGINFDRCWEGTMSDMLYDPEICRNISLDMRYALFIIDKFGGAGYLLDEMEIRQ